MSGVPQTLQVAPAGPARGEISGQPLSASPSPSPMGGSSPGLPATAASPTTASPLPPIPALPSSPTTPLKRKLSRNYRPSIVTASQQHDSILGSPPPPPSPHLASPAQTHRFPRSPSLTGSPRRAASDRLPLFMDAEDIGDSTTSTRARFSEHLPIASSSPSTSLARHSSGGASHYASILADRLPQSAGEMSGTDENGIPRRLRRWSTVGRSRRATAQWASPYLQAGLEELKSIFDVDSHPIPSGSYEEAELMLCPCQRNLSPSPSHPQSDEHAHTSTGTAAEAGSEKLGAPWDPTPPHSSTSNRGPRAPCTGESCPARLSLWNTDESQRPVHDRDDDHARPRPSPGAGSMGRAEQRGTWDARPDLKRGAWSEGPRKEEKDRLARKHALVATGLVGVGLGMILVCTVGTMYYSDVFSLALLACLALQPLFAVIGIAGIVSKRRALMDMASRALRAHVLAQCLVSIVAFLELSASSSGRAKSSRGTFGSASSNVSATSSSSSSSSSTPLRFFRGMRDFAGAAPEPSIVSGSAQLHAHDTRVGSLSSRTYHLVSFGVQVALPILFALWLQYAVALGLASLARAGKLSGGHHRSYQSPSQPQRERQPERSASTGSMSARAARARSRSNKRDPTSTSEVSYSAFGAGVSAAHAPRESSAVSMTSSTSTSSSSSDRRPVRSTSLRTTMTPSWRTEELPPLPGSPAGSVSSMPKGNATLVASHTVSGPFNFNGGGAPRAASRMRRAPHSQSGAGKMSGHARSFSQPVIPPTPIPHHGGVGGGARLFDHPMPSPLNNESHVVEFPPSTPTSEDTPQGLKMG